MLYVCVLWSILLEHLTGTLVHPTEIRQQISGLPAEGINPDSFICIVTYVPFFVYCKEGREKSVNAHQIARFFI
jgi:hypothetical protein